MQDVMIILYGSTGDLTFRKILPALIQLKEKKLLPNKTKVLAVGRREFTNDDYYNFIIERNKQITKEDLKSLVGYTKMQITDSDDYSDLKKYLDQETNSETVVIHYLAIGSNLMEGTISALFNNNIANKNKPNHKLVFEKPFGNNYQEAVELNQYLEQYFLEDQIYRVDHYLGKPFVKYLINLKQKNDLLNQILKPKFIKSISVMLKEHDGVLDRGPFYDQTGALLDMFQSHILQIVTLLTMKIKKKMSYQDIIKEKTKVLSKLTFNFDSLVFGQYLGYLDEDKIDDNSLTETLFFSEITVKNNFKRIPIYVYTGKNLDEKKSLIKIKMKDGSILTINLHPTIDITIVNKEVTSQIKLDDEVLDDYANLIMKIINNNKSLFVSDKEILLMHQITDQIRDHKKELLIYKKDLKISDINENF